MMQLMFRKAKYIIVLVILLLLLSPSQAGDHIIPVTYLVSEHESIDSITTDKDLTAFIIEMAEPNYDTIAGIYVKDKLQLLVTQQPSGQPGFVTTSGEAVTEFTYAAEHGSVGLLAHNHLAGSEFFEIESGDEIFLVRGNGLTERYVVSEIQQYQALAPTSPYSSFVNLSDRSQNFTYEELFFNIYGKTDSLILQTCISNQDSSSWGRHFVIAVPAEDKP